MQDNHKKMKKTFSLFVCLALFLQCLQAQKPNEAEIRRSIGIATAKMKSLQCDFTQTKYLKMLNDKMIAHGKMYYQQSDKLRWQYTSPYAYTFVLNGTKVMLAKGNRSDVIDVDQNKMFREIARIMMNSVIGKSLADTKDFATTITATATEYVATLTPLRKDMKQMFQRVVLHFNRRQSMVSTVELVEKKGDRTVIELTNAKINTAINAKTFSVN